MDPATIKLAAQLISVLARSKALRRVLAGLVAVALAAGAAVGYGTWALTQQLAASMRVESCIAAATAGTAETTPALTTGGDSSVPLPAENPAARLQVTVVSWNTYYKNSVDNIVRGFHAIEAAGGDVVGLQEQNSPAKLRQLQRRLSPGWTFVGANTRQPIAYRTAGYQRVASGVEVEHGPHRMESGPGGRSIGTKYVVWVELRDVHTGATFIEINDHKVAGVEVAGRARKDKPIRVRLWRQEDAAVGRLITRLKPLGVPLFKTADENLADRPGSKFGYAEAMARRGLYSNWRVLGRPHRGTHGTRLIDFVWATTSLAAPVRQRILPSYGSDHHPVAVDLDNAKAASAAVATTTVKPKAPRPVTATGTGSTTTADEKAVWLALHAVGFDDAHAAAVMGSMKDESGFDPQIIQGGGHSTSPAAAGGGGYGLVQWTPGRKLSDYIGGATPTVQNEVAALKKQLDGQGPHPEKAAGDAFRAAVGTAAAARVFHLRYERSASKNSAHRVANALDIEQRLAGTATTTSSAPTVAPCAAASAMMTDATDVDVAGTRTVTDPTSHKTYRVDIPAGPRGVAINFALDQLGKPYVWGSRGPDFYDCSGLVSAAWAKAGVHFTAQTEAMYREIPHTKHPQPGDLTYHPGHTQMVLNDGLILEAPHTGATVRIIDRNWMKPTAWFDPTQMEQR